MTSRSGRRSLIVPVRGKHSPRVSVATEGASAVDSRRSSRNIDDSSDEASEEEMRDQQAEVAEVRGSPVDSSKPGELENSSEPKSIFPGITSQLENTMSALLAEFREKAEDALTSHLQALDAAQDANDQKLTLVRTENNKLRQLLGLKPEDSQQLHVAYQNFVAAESAGKGKIREAAPSFQNKSTMTPTSKASPKHTELELFDGLSGAAMKSQKQVKGIWQSFMAWVPVDSTIQAQFTSQSWQPLAPGELPAKPKRAASQQPYREASKPSSKLLSPRFLPPLTGVDATSLEQSALQLNAAVVPGYVSHAQGGKQNHDQNSDDKVHEIRSFEDEASDEDDEEEDSSGYQLLELWEVPAQMMKKMKSFCEAGAEKTPSSVAFTEEEDDGNTQVSCCILLPDSTGRLCWDFVGIQMLLYDVVTIPLYAFELSSPFLDVMEWITRIFWTVDPGFSCCTGLTLSDGKVEGRRKEIVMTYLRTWFALDVLIISSDWLGVILSSGEANVSRLARLSRIARSVRLLRLVRMKEVFANVLEHFQLDQVSFALHLGKALALVLTLSHFIGCGWWALTDRAADSEALEYHIPGSSGDGAAYYLMSLHWGLSQFSGIIDPLSPASGPERLYATVIGLFAFTTSLLLVCVLTSRLTQQFIIDNQVPRQLAALKTFLRQNSIPKNLSMRLCRNATHAVSGDLTEDSVELLGVISEPLKLQMLYEMYSRVIAWHPFFYDLKYESNTLLRKICTQAMSFVQLAEGDVVFKRGEEAEPHMYIVVQGTLIYVDEYGEETLLEEKRYVSEAVLWTEWTHQGTLAAKSHVKLGVLHANVMHEICTAAISSSKPSCLPFLRYAKSFIDELKSSEHPTDLPQ